MVLRSLGSLIHDERYEREILLKEKSHLLGCTRYKEYPLVSFTNGKFRAFLEGHIYGKDYAELNQEICELERAIFQGGLKAEGQILEWLLAVDGDFVLFILNKEGSRIAILNDTLGRLPVYYYQKPGEELLVSRELRFITNLMSDKRFDRMALAQHLLFDFPLGKRTLLEKVYRLEPASLLQVDIDRKLVEIRNLHYLNFDVREHAHSSFKKNTSELVSLFSEGCKKRSSPTGKNIVSLSGGLNSRLVAAGFYQAGIPFSAVTFLDFEGLYKSDVEIAKQIASLLKVDWQVFHLDAPKGKHLLKLLRTKNGLNCLAMSYIFPFCEKVIQTFGAGVRDFHGEGADVLLHDYLRPSIHLRNIDDLVNYFTSIPNLSLRTIANLTRLGEHEIIDELRDHFSTYPEREPNQQFAHFQIYEKYFKWNSEGEDRDRLYFWLTSPFWYNRFFDYAKNCPDVQRERGALYREFLRQLSPGAADIEICDAHTVITSNRFRIEQFLGFVPLAIIRRLPILGSPARKLRKLVVPTSSYDHGSLYLSCMREQEINCSSINEYLSRPVLDDVIENYDRYNRAEIQRLFTVTSSIEDIACGVSTIEKYSESEFV